MHTKTTSPLVYCALLNRHCIIALIIITEDKTRKEKKRKEKPGKIHAQAKARQASNAEKAGKTV